MRFEDVPRDAARRPIVDDAYRALIAALVRAEPEHFGALDPGRILVIAAAARRASSASVRPLTFGGSPPVRALGAYVKPTVHVGGRDMLYEIALRPRFFLEYDARSRLTVFAHELWHIAPTFDGTLAPERRHHQATPGAIDGAAEAIARRVFDAPEGELARRVFGYAGELRLSAWRERPASREPRGTSARLHYGEDDLYSAIIEQR